MQWIREKFGAAIVTVIIGLISLVFIFYGVFAPKATRGMHEGTVAGTVNGEAISLREYQQSLNQRLEFFRKMAGGKISEEQLRAFRVQESVFRELVQRKLMIQEAHRMGLTASDEEVKQAILDIPAFQKDGKFDLVAYKQTIEASPYGSTGNFEKLIRDDLSAQRWNDYFMRRIHVSDAEARQDFLMSHNKRSVKYVLLNSENGRKGVEVKSEEIKKYLADASKMNLVKAQFDARKEAEFKGKTLEQAQNEIARDLIASERLADIQKINEKLADQVQAALTADKGSDARVNALLKAYGASVKSTGLFSQQGDMIPGVGESKELMADAFQEPSPIGAKAKKYTQPGAIVVAVVSEVQHADAAKFDAERDNVMKQLTMKKQRSMFESFLKKISDKAKIDMNPDVVNGGEPTES
ncbi:MAG: SurA N-terminal domain-containing protein [Bdellovibrionia bacterium]